VEFFNHDISSDDPIVGLTNLDIIVSNPPYIPLREKEILDANVRDHEPEGALFVPDDNPLLFYSHIANCGSHIAIRDNLILAKRGMLYLEIHENFGEEVCRLLEEKGFEDIILKKDINGKDRMVRARQPESRKAESPKS